MRMPLDPSPHLPENSRLRRSSPAVSNTILHFKMIPKTLLAYRQKLARNVPACRVGVCVIKDAQCWGTWEARESPFLIARAPLASRVPEHCAPYITKASAAQAIVTVLYAPKESWKLALAFSPRRVSKRLGRVQIVDFLLHCSKSLAQWRAPSKFRFQPWSAILNNYSPKRR